ncbi:hypothetical protein TRFO_37530 [Tritrichomonas foetus]|uniref:Transmembrane amino acid transporter protein n=1 Tax=Tritrichomonas foetus TaxID=1144522 RepID=A0A1J4JAY2_9EUKA|nr:hypothetical protein TRFO_37530 [Tritrichomonas foetus]|eukprot:OHS96312.1 hypothetical protein TRFO_37530 [Tritrichomonas foetus]
MIGGDLKVSEHRFQGRSRGSDYVLFPTSLVSNRVSMVTAIMLLLKIAISSDPFIVSPSINCGVVQALFITVLVFLMMQLSIHLYIRCWFFGLAYNYTDVWSCVFGSTFKFIPAFMNICIFFSYILYHTYEVYHYMQLFILELWPTAIAFVTDKWFIIYIVNTIAFLPAILASRLSKIKVIAFIGNFAALIALVFLVVVVVTHNGENGYKSPNELALFKSGKESTIAYINDVSEAFFIQSMLNLAFVDMVNPTMGRCTKSIWISGIIYACFFYLAWLCRSFIKGVDFTEDNVFYSFNVKIPAVAIGRIATYVLTITSCQFYVFYISSQFSVVFLKENVQDSAPAFIVGFCVLLFSIGINFVGEQALLYVDYIANFSFILLVFVLPSVYYLKLFKNSNKLLCALAILLMLIGFPLGLIVFYFSNSYNLT